MFVSNRVPLGATVVGVTHVILALFMLFWQSFAVHYLHSHHDRWCGLMAEANSSLWEGNSSLWEGNSTLFLPWQWDPEDCGHVLEKVVTVLFAFIALSALLLIVSYSLIRGSMTGSKCLLLPFLVLESLLVSALLLLVLAVVNMHLPPRPATIVFFSALLFLFLPIFYVGVVARHFLELKNSEGLITPTDD